MIKDLGEIVKGYFEPYLIGGTGSNTFIDTLAGVVKVITTSDKDKDNRKVIKRFPVSCSLTLDQCISGGRYMDLVPDSKKGCIVYMEDVQASTKVGQEGPLEKWKSQLRVVCWVNQKKLGRSECSITGKIFQTFLAALPDQPVNNGNFIRLDVSAVSQDPINYNPFAKYSYDEEKTQFMMHPYDYFSFVIELNYNLNKSCITEFTKQPEIPC
jgi:hypothetical protein